MSPPYDLICVGDTMVECIVSPGILPLANQPLVIDAVPQQFGGSAFNLCWYLKQFSLRPLLVGPAGTHQSPLISDAVVAAQLDDAGLIWIEEDTDFLLVMQVEGNQYTLYILARLPQDIASRIIAQCSLAPYIVITGSRHPQIREAHMAIAATVDGRSLAFTPSYPIYQYSAEELSAILRKAHISILNEHEAAFVMNQLQIDSEQQLAEYVPHTLIITKAHRGADLYEYGMSEKIGSYSNREGDIIGAGDAFFAGFLYRALQAAPLNKAAHYGAATAALVVDTLRVRTHVSTDSVQRKLALPCQFRP